MNDGPKTREEWQISVDEFLNSGLTQKEFCKQNRLILARFVYYLQLHRKKQNQTNSPQEPSSFSEVIVKKSANSLQDEIKIELPNGFRCQVACNIQPDQLKKYWEQYSHANAE